MELEIPDFFGSVLNGKLMEIRATDSFNIVIKFSVLWHDAEQIALIPISLRETNEPHY